MVERCGEDGALREAILQREDLPPTVRSDLLRATAIALADILYEAGLPPEMFQIVTGMPDSIGDEMVTNSDIELITFTGGVKVGKLIANKAGYRRAALELGGNDPLIICDDLSDSDLDKAAELAVADHNAAGVQ